LGLDPSMVTVVTGDTDRVQAGLGTFASRSVQIAGSAVWQAAEAVVERGRLRAAAMFEAAPDDVVLDPVRHGFTVRGTPALFAGWGEVAQAIGADDGTLTETAMFDGAMTFPFGAHLAVVEIDVETGNVRLLRMVVADDAGRIVHPRLFDGQVHGGIAQGVGEMLFEEFVYGEDGTPLTTTLADYLVPSAAELPSFELVRSETPTPLNPLGAKGIGESGTIGSAAAVHNAVCDALAHLGVSHLDPPLSPERIWRAIRTAPTPSSTCR
jgi:carbon-monoxide dehydrogenase large subunit